MKFKCIRKLFLGCATAPLIMFSILFTASTAAPIYPTDESVSTNLSIYEPNFIAFLLPSRFISHKSQNSNFSSQDGTSSSGQNLLAESSLD